MRTDLQRGLLRGTRAVCVILHAKTKMAIWFVRAWQRHFRGRALPLFVLRIIIRTHRSQLSRKIRGAGGSHAMRGAAAKMQMERSDRVIITRCC